MADPKDTLLFLDRLEALGFNNQAFPNYINLEKINLMQASQLIVTIPRKL
jgi:hypothetical protein